VSCELQISRFVVDSSRSRKLFVVFFLVFGFLPDVGDSTTNAAAGQ
jgi:preprotein translocase subunit Sec63